MFKNSLFNDFSAEKKHLATYILKILCIGVDLKTDNVLEKIRQYKAALEATNDINCLDMITLLLEGADKIADKQILALCDKMPVPLNDCYRKEKELSIVKNGKVDIYDFHRLQMIKLKKEHYQASVENSKEFLERLYIDNVIDLSLYDNIENLIDDLAQKANDEDFAKRFLRKYIPDIVIENSEFKDGVLNVDAYYSTYEETSEIDRRLGGAGETVRYSAKVEL